MVVGGGKVSRAEEDNEGRRKWGGQEERMGWGRREKGVKARGGKWRQRQWMRTGRNRWTGGGDGRAQEKTEGQGVMGKKGR